MLDVLDVAKYIINYSNKKEYGISNLRLQKLLYFVQACYLALTKEGKPCFDDKIEALDFGPVVQIVYNEFKRFGNGNIPIVDLLIEIPDEDKKCIEIVVDSFSEYSTTNMMKLIHNQKPWYNAYYNRGKNAEITKASIKRYFKK